jgi:hypothetical protein
MGCGQTEGAGIMVRGCRASLDRTAEGGRPYMITATYREASQTRDYCVAKNAPHREPRPDSSRRKGRAVRNDTPTSHRGLDQLTGGVGWPNITAFEGLVFS